MQILQQGHERKCKSCSKVKKVNERICKSCNKVKESYQENIGILEQVKKVKGLILKELLLVTLFIRLMTSNGAIWSRDQIIMR